MSETLLVGIDGGSMSENAVMMACKQAKSSGARLLVVYVIEWSPYTFNTPEENEQRKKRYIEEIEIAQSRVLDPLIERIKQDGVEVEGVVRHGSPAELIIYLAKEHSATQIFIGRRGASGIKQMLFGSVVANLVQASPVPVTVAP